jgi:hypothetical protein
MNGMITFLNQQLPVLQLVLLIATLVGGVFVFKNTKKTGIVQIQSETIIAQQQQIDSLKDQSTAQQEKIDRLEFELKAMRDALKDEGILITVDGERITIKDTREPDTTRHIIKRPTKKTTTTAHVVKKEEGT